MRESKIVQTLERHIERLEMSLSEREIVIGKLMTALMEKEGKLIGVDLGKREEPQREEKLVPVPGEFYQP